MAASSQKVYLDHHIARDNLLYRRAITPEDNSSGDEPYLKVEHLMTGDSSRAELLRKPDFQRATWAWTPDDCVSLLQSVLTEQVVPSVILWLNPESLWYVLDGGHRISVLLAWLRDDWGDRRPAQDYKDESLEKNSKEAGRRVRELLKKHQIGPFEEYLQAHRRYKDLTLHGKDVTLEMSTEEITYAKLVRRWQSVNMGFPILWVKGDYEKAEESFLNINKSGRQLSPWETTLVENRRSSFARAVTSVARVSDREHCWPLHAPEVKNDPRARQQIEEILKTVQELHALLFTPVYQKPITEPRQPLLATPYTRPELQAAYTAELLTITEGNKGQPPEMRRLLQRDAKEPVPVMITNGQRLLVHAREVIENIAGKSPRSLALVPLVYFYNTQGTFVRSLLYGMIYWLNRGTTTEVQSRKRLFTLHRGAFENVLLENKDRVIGRIGRRIGSGPEVTYPTALYFDGLLTLLIEHDDRITDEQFRSSHENLIETLSTDDQPLTSNGPVSTDRLFRGKARETVHVGNFVKMFQECSICGGRFYPSDSTHIDHVVQHARGGPTVPSNARETHPFCNNQREVIEALRAGQEQLSLPQFEDPRKLPKAQQLSFLSFIEDPETEEPGDNPLLEELESSGDTDVPTSDDEST